MPGIARLPKNFELRASSCANRRQGPELSANNPASGFQRVARARMSSAESPKVGAGDTAPRRNTTRYSVTRVPSSTTWFGGRPKKSAAVPALRYMVANTASRQ